VAVRKISLKAVTELAPGQTVWDAEVKGFGVRRQRRVAVYVLKFRDHDGRQHFMTIGRHGSPWTPDEARKEAKRRLHTRTECLAGPSALALASPTLETFSRTYLESYARLHKKPRSVAEDRRNLELHILPALGPKKLAEITAADIARFHTGRGTCPSNANRCLALLSHIFSIGAKWGVIPAGINPCRGIKRFRERIRERFLSAEEVVSLGRVIAEVDRPTGDAREDWRAVNILRLLVYTGAHLSEVLTLQWGWIHWDEGYARLPDSKTGTKTLPLPKPALDVLRGLSDAHGRQSKFVFPGKRNGTFFTGIQKPWQRIRLRAGLPDVRIHDLRHCFASTAVSHGESLFLVGAVLGHRTTSTTQRYAHLAMQPILESANRTSIRLAALMQQTITASVPADGNSPDSFTAKRHGRDLA
jgi:integrase